MPFASAVHTRVRRIRTARSIEELDEIVVVGSRRQDRPVGDRIHGSRLSLIDGDQLRNQGATDMDSLLAMTISSYNVDQQAINDAATLVRPARDCGVCRPIPHWRLSTANGVTALL